MSGGGLMQINLKGASGVDYCFTNYSLCDAYTCNTQKSLQYYYINRDGGVPTKEDIELAHTGSLILDNTPDDKKPKKGSLEPYSVRSENNGSLILDNTPDDKKPKKGSLEPYSVKNESKMLDYYQYMIKNGNEFK
jgi:hypothetical protein